MNIELENRIERIVKLLDENKAEDIEVFDLSDYVTISGKCCYFSKLFK